MHCTDCGYSMTAFDKDCPRCVRLRARRKGCPQCGTAAPLEAAQCVKCGHTFRTSFAHEQAARRDEIVDEGIITGRPAEEGITEDLWNSPVPPLASPSAPPRASASPPAAPIQASTTPLNAEMLACRVCGSTSAQKVSAVCQAGMWSGVSHGRSVGAIYTPDGVLPVSSVSATSSTGGTRIAQLLAPPPRPFFQHRWVASVFVPIIGYLTALALSGQGALTVSVAIALTSVVWFLALLSEARAEAAGQARLQTDHARWQEGMKVWDRLFYCSRCDHVYDPQGGGTAPPSGIFPLLFSHLSPVMPLHPRELPLRLPPEKAAAIVGGTTLVALALFWGVNWNAGRQEGPAQAVSTTPENIAPADTSPPPISPSPPTDPALANDPALVPPAYQMTTKAGGGAPPDLSRFKH